MYSPSKWGIGYLNSPLVDAGVGGGRVADEDFSTRGAGGFGIDGGLGIPLSFLARGGRVLLPDELSLQLVSSSLLLLLFCDLAGGLASAALRCQSTLAFIS